MRLSEMTHRRSYSAYGMRTAILSTLRLLVNLCKRRQEAALTVDKELQGHW